jgi:hypothetical protein
LGSVSSFVSEKKIFEISANKCSNAFFLETTTMIKAKLYMNVHWMVLYNLKVFCSDKKLSMSCGGGHLGFPIGIKDSNLVKDIPMIIPGQFGFNCPSGFREEAF